jgi:hypothetical protein
MGPHQPHPMVVGAGLGLRPGGSNQLELAKCRTYRASHSLIPVFKGSWSIEGRRSIAGDSLRDSFASRGS